MNISKFDNLLLNLAGGLKPEHLHPNEVELLKQGYGENWFEMLGYKEPDDKKPVFASCAGMLELAKEDDEHLEGFDI